MINSRLMHKELKKRITITVEPELINKAHQAGIKNISGFTSSMLRVMIADAEKDAPNELISALSSFFIIIQPLLEHYGFSLKVGYSPAEKNNSKTEELIMLTEGQLQIEDQHGKFVKATSVNDVYTDIDSPTKILENLLLSLIRSQQMTKQKIQELELASKFFKTIFDNKSDIN